MTNRNGNSSVTQNERRNTVDITTDWIVSIVLSFGTAFSVCALTARLFDYYVGERFKQGLDAGAGMVFIFLFGLPILFVIALVIWKIFARQSRDLINAFTRWIVSLTIGLGVGYLIILTMSNNWKTESYSAFVHNQELIVLGFPFFSLGIYALVLAILRRVLRAAV